MMSVGEETRSNGAHPEVREVPSTKEKCRRLPARVELPVVEPWLEAVNGAILLDLLVALLRRFVVFPKWVAEMLALWILHTFAYQLRDVTTYLAIESPEKECGKSTLLTVLSHLVNRPAVSSNISSSAFFHAIEELEPTLLMDEADSNLRARREMRGILNAGYTKPTAHVWRMMYKRAARAEREVGEVQGEVAARKSNGELVQYSSWCPKAIATIGHLDDTLASRCIVIRMQRKIEGEECERLKMLKATELKRQCARFVQDHADEIANAEPVMPKALTNRAADIWEPLLALADLAGGHWPELARQAAEGLTMRAQQHSPIGALLMDIASMFLFGEAERLFSRDIVAVLNNKEGRPWAELRRGKKVNESWLATQLRPYGIRPATIRIGDEVAKGYLVEDFKDTFRRYVPRSEVEAFKADLAARTVRKEEGEAKPVERKA